MRLIFGFIFFGILFYAIWYFFPDAFNTMVSWVAKVFNYIANLFGGVAESHPAPSPTTTPTAPSTGI